MENQLNPLSILERTEDGKLFREFSQETGQYTVTYFKNFTFTLVPIHNGIILKDGGADEDSVLFFPKDTESDYPYHPGDIFNTLWTEWGLERDTADLWTQGFFWGLEQISHLEWKDTDSDLSKFKQYLILEEMANGSDRVANGLKKIKTTNPKQMAEEIFLIYYKEMGGEG